MRYPRSWFTALCLSALPGCALLRPAPAPSPPPLIAPRAYARTSTLRQRVSIHRGEKTSQYNTVIQLHPDNLRIIWFGTLGARLFSVDWDGSSICVKAPAGLPGGLSPHRLLADVQAVYAPVPALRHALARSGWSVNRPRPGVRVMAFNGRPRVRVEYAHPGSVVGEVRVRHLDLGLRITIDSRRLATTRQAGGSQ